MFLERDMPGSGADFRASRRAAEPDRAEPAYGEGGEEGEPPGPVRPDRGVLRVHARGERCGLHHGRGERQRLDRGYAGAPSRAGCLG